MNRNGKCTLFILVLINFSLKVHFQLCVFASLREIFCLAKPRSRQASSFFASLRLCERFFVSSSLQAVKKLQIVNHSFDTIFNKRFIKIDE